MRAYRVAVELWKEGFYKFGTVLCFLLFKVVFRLRVFGRENIPESGNFIIVARHRSFWDIPLVVVALGPRYRIHFVARKTLIDEYLMFRPFVGAYAITIDREHFKKGDFVKVLSALEQGKIVGIFPEGTTKQGAPVHSGVIRFAQRAGREFLPVKIKARGPYPPKFLEWPKLDIFIGKPFGLRDLEFDLNGAEGRHEREDKLSQLLMQRVDGLGSEYA